MRHPIPFSSVSNPITPTCASLAVSAIPTLQPPRRTSSRHALHAVSSWAIPWTNAATSAIIQRLNGSSYLVMYTSTKLVFCLRRFLQQVPKQHHEQHQAALTSFHCQWCIVLAIGRAVLHLWPLRAPSPWRPHPWQVRTSRPHQRCQRRTCRWALNRLRPHPRVRPRPLRASQHQLQLRQHRLTRSLSIP